MQVSNQANSVYYPSYQRSVNTKRSAAYHSAQAVQRTDSVNPVNANQTERDEAAVKPPEDYQTFLREKINELYTKIRNGETETSYQIGAQSFTEKEWDAFLEKFDDVEKELQELMKEEQAKRAAEQTKREQAGAASDTTGLLTTESTSCTYPAANPKESDIRYITWYTEEGIFCRRAGQSEGYEWSIPFENRRQYDKVMEFIAQFSADWNMRFAAHENFWRDFLNDEINLDEFMKFMEGTNKGVPDYSMTIGDSMYIDKDKIQWAKYLNSFGNQFYTAEEFQKQQMELIASNASKKTKISSPR